MSDKDTELKCWFCHRTAKDVEKDFDVLWDVVRKRVGKTSKTTDDYYDVDGAMILAYGPSTDAPTIDYYKEGLPICCVCHSYFELIRPTDEEIKELADEAMDEWNVVLTKGPR